ncbi:MAG: hypothetical protein AAB309_06975 [Deltaproteobacteria bacterium]
MLITKLKKGAFLALTIFMVAGAFLSISRSAAADPVCGTLEECQALRKRAFVNRCVNVI